MHLHRAQRQGHGVKLGMDEHAQDSFERRIVHAASPAGRTIEPDAAGGRKILMRFGSGTGAQGTLKCRVDFVET